MEKVEALAELKQNRTAMAGLVLICFLLILGLIGPWISPHPPLVPDPIHRLKGPSWSHPFGTDSLGRDILSRVIYGSRISIIIGLIPVSISLVPCTILGLLSGFLLSLLLIYVINKQSFGWTIQFTIPVMRLIEFWAIVMVTSLIAGLIPARRAARLNLVESCGTNDTRTTIAGAKRAVAAGADALLVVSPYYNKPNASGMLAHYRAVAEAAGVPIVPYNVPGRTGQNLGVELILEIARIPGVVAVKEAAANLEQVADLVAGRREGFAVLSGDDSLVVPSLALGIDGVISVVSNEAPAETARMAQAGLHGPACAATARE